MDTAEPALRLEEQRPREILRQASVALQGPMVVLWECRSDGELSVLLTSTPEPRYTVASLDVDATLRRWGIPFVPGARWVGCRPDGASWCLAPVRHEPAAPPPGNRERRSHVRMTLELAGLCIGLAGRRPAAPDVRRPDPDAMAELARHPSTIAHEVASPLTASLANLDECIDSVRHHDLDDKLRAGLLENLSGIEAGLHRAVGYLRSIQSRARDSNAEHERFDAVRVVQACVALERPFARRGGSRLSVDAPPEAIFLRGDPNGLYRILTNLIRNAVHASTGRNEVVAVALGRSGNALRLSVRDKGVGIAPAQLDRVFEPGFTTKPVGEGSGMGLAIARQLAEQKFRGRISVDSELGQGSTFTVVLPLPPQRPSGAHAVV